MNLIWKIFRVNNQGPVLLLIPGCVTTYFLDAIFISIPTVILLLFSLNSLYGIFTNPAI